MLEADDGSSIARIGMDPEQLEHDDKIREGLAQIRKLDLVSITNVWNPKYRFYSNSLEPTSELL
jgi:hypothetical protein